MFDEKDLQQIREHGLTPEQAETQLENFRRGFPFLNVVRAAHNKYRYRDHQKLYCTITFTRLAWFFMLFMSLREP